MDDGDELAVKQEIEYSDTEKGQNQKDSTVNGVFSGDPKMDADAELLEEVTASGLLALGVRTSVDRFLPQVVLKFGMECFVVNGRFPERVSEVLAGKSTVCTRIIPK